MFKTLLRLAAHLTHEILNTGFDGSPLSSTLELGQNVHDQNPCKERDEQNEQG
jgi:hypothetical protein